MKIFGTVTENPVLLDSPVSMCSCEKYICMHKHTDKHMSLLS